MDAWYLDAIWISVAFLGGYLAKRISLPPLIGFLIAGFALNLFGFIDGGVALDAAANLGVMLLLFTIGLKLNLRSLLAPEIWLATSIQLVIMTVVFGLIIFLLSYFGLTGLAHLDTNSALIIGFALSFSSTVFAIKTLEDRGEVTSFHGNLAVGILVMQDIAAVAFLTFTGESSITLWIMALPVYLFLIRFILLHMLNSIDHGELFTLFGFFAAFVAGALSFKFFGLKADLGALIIGIMLAPHKRAKELTKHMMGYKDFFLVAFFLKIGLTGLPNLHNVVLAFILVVFMLFKGGLFMYLFTRFKLRARTSWLATLSLANYSEFGLIVAAIGYEEGLIEAQWIVVIALALSISFIVSSPLNVRAHKLFDKYQSKITALNKNCEHPDDEIRNLGDAEYLICGMGRIGKVVYHYLHGKYGDKVIGIDYNPDQVEKLKSANKNVFWGDSTDIIFWKNADLKNIKMVFLSMTDYTSNMNAAREIAVLKDKGFMVGSTSRFPDQIVELKKAGVDFVYNYYDRLGADFAEHFIMYGENKINTEITNEI